MFVFQLWLIYLAQCVSHVSLFFNSLCLFLLLLLLFLPVMFLIFIHASNKLITYYPVIWFVKDFFFCTSVCRLLQKSLAKSMLLLFFQSYHILSLWSSTCSGFLRHSIFSALVRSSAMIATTPTVVLMIWRSKGWIVIVAVATAFTTLPILQ